MALFDSNPLSSVTDSVSSGLGSLFEGMNVFGARPSEALTGILTTDQQDKLRKQALLQGLLGGVATYLATPKNLNAGSALPYLGKAYLGGMQASQGAYDQSLAGKVKQLELEQGAKKLELEGLTPLEKLMRRKEILERANPNDPQVAILNQAIAQESGALKGFGAGVEGASLNLLARGSENTPEGEKIRKTPAFALAYKNQTSPKYVDQVRMDENGNEYYVRVQIPATKLPPNILPPIYGDLTAATKFMKLLDPGSVVRESELYLAMNATGLIDRIANYKSRLENGEVLNPKQREDFRNVANQLFKAAGTSNAPVILLKNPAPALRCANLPRSVACCSLNANASCGGKNSGIPRTSVTPVSTGFFMPLISSANS